MIPHIPISADRMNELCSIMANGNLIGRRTFSEFLEKGLLTIHDYCYYRRLVYKQPDTEFLKDLSADDIEAMQAVNTVQNEIVHGFIKYCVKVSSQDDIAGPVLPLIAAIYYYSDLKVSFLTYAVTCIRRNIQRMYKSQKVKISNATDILPVSSEVSDYTEFLQKATNETGVFSDDINLAKKIFESSGLSPIERDAFIAKYIEKRSFSVVAIQHERSDQAIFLALKRAKKKINRCLVKEGLYERERGIIV